jgi:hypothetical protein
VDKAGQNLRIDVVLVEVIPTQEDLNGTNFRCRYRLRYRLDADMQSLVLRVVKGFGICLACRALRGDRSPRVAPLRSDDPAQHVAKHLREIQELLRPQEYMHHGAPYPEQTR